MRTEGGRLAARSHGMTVSLAQRVASFLRQVAGMPDYHGYLAHARRCHPDRPPLGEREFFAEYLKARYADGPSRCC